MFYWTKGILVREFLVRAYVSCTRLNSSIALDSNFYVIYCSTIYTVNALGEGGSGIISISVKFLPPLLAALSSATLTELIERKREKKGWGVSGELRGTTLNPVGRDE